MSNWVSSTAKTVGTWATNTAKAVGNFFSPSSNSTAQRSGAAGHITPTASVASRPSGGGGGILASSGGAVPAAAASSYYQQQNKDGTFTLLPGHFNNVAAAAQSYTRQTCSPNSGHASAGDAPTVNWEAVVSGLQTLQAFGQGATIAFFNDVARSLGQKTVDGFKTIDGKEVAFSVGSIAGHVVTGVVGLYMAANGFNFALAGIAGGAFGGPVGEATIGLSSVAVGSVVAVWGSSLVLSAAVGLATDPNIKFSTGNEVTTNGGTNNWGNESTLQDHFERHGSDFGAKSPNEYAEKANEFYNHKSNYQVKVDENGVVRVYDSETNTFGSYNSDGTTRTFFKPTGGQSYFNSQPGK